jgi:hypothetical protein
LSISAYCQLWVITDLKLQNSRTAAGKGMYSYVGSDVHHNNHIAFRTKVKLERFGTIKAIANNQF